MTGDEHEPEGEGERPLLTISEAARASGHDRRTVRRWLDGGRFPNAARDPEDQRWRIPVSDLVAAGIQLYAPAEPEPEPEPDVLDALRAERDEYRRRAEVAEAVSAERGRALDDLRAAMRALTAGQHEAALTEPTTTAPSAPRRRWWERRR